MAKVSTGESNRKKHTVSFSMSEDTRKMLEQQANDKNLNPSAYIERLIFEKETQAGRKLI